MLRVTGVKLSLDEDKALILSKTAKKLRVKENEILAYSIFRESIDARKSDQIFFVYTVDVQLANESAVLKKLKGGEVTVTPPMDYRLVQPGHQVLPHRPVVVGLGPAGLFAGLLLARMGYRPVILERGADVDTRTEAVRSFWQTGLLDKDCNVQFGEGGAGAFSDGKLTTLIKDKRCRRVLEEMVQAGAPDDIIYSYKPHIGTDLLKTVVKTIRRQIIELGGEVHFNSRVTGIFTEDSRLTGLEINGEQTLEAEVALLAIGHSARDTFAMLHSRGLLFTPKSFSIGVRVEHPQALINQAQHKSFAGHPRLGPAEYKLAYHSPTGRSAYTFCMCPGGMVVAAASEEGMLVTNGMSEHARDRRNANSALLVGVRPEDFGSDYPLAGVEFQRRWEGLAFRLGGGNYVAPAQLVGDFLSGRPSTGPGGVEPSYPRGVTYTDLQECLPGYVTATLQEALLDFDRKLRGFALPEAVLTGVETRSSSPVRIYRDEQCRSNIVGLYPAGEGPGYAGGIISSAVDGMRAAECIALHYAPDAAAV